MTIVYGAIGYVIMYLGDKQVIVFSDMHNKLPFCKEYIHITEWIQYKLKTHRFLLEEIERGDKELVELWPNSVHTQKLKNFYLNNTSNVIAIDVRPFLVIFSWELLYKGPVESHDRINLQSYLSYIQLFYSFRHSFFSKKIYIYNIISIAGTPAAQHLKFIYNSYRIFKKKYKHMMHKTISYIFYNYIQILKDFNNLIDDIMEWYTCVVIYLYNSNDIIHTGLAHSETIIYLLQKFYNFVITKKYGIFNIKDSNSLSSGCVSIDI